MTNLCFRTALAVLVALSLPGCALEGERAARDGACPAGEICSDTAPAGLTFQGAQPADNFFGAVGVLTTAVGGTQTVTVSTDLGFTAMSATPSILGVDAVTPPTVLVHGKGDGSGTLRVLAPDTDELLDRVDLQVAPITKATVLPLDLAIVALGPEELRNAPWAMLAGTATSTKLVVHLMANDVDRAVDEGLTLTPASGSASQLKWDLFDVSVPSTNSTASFSIHAGGATFQASAAVVTTIDDIMSLPINDSSGVALGGLSTFCFVAQSGGASVGGAEWTFSGSAGITVAASEIPGNVCVNVTGTAEGPATLTATASGMVKAIDLTVIGNAPQQKRAPLHRRTATPTLGERATLAAR